MDGPRDDICEEMTMAKKKKYRMLSNYDLFLDEKSVMFTFLIEDIPDDWIDRFRLMDHEQRVKWLGYQLFIHNLKENVES